MQWLADSNLLEMIVDKLNPLVSGTFSHSLMQLIKYLCVYHVGCLCWISLARILGFELYVLFCLPSKNVTTFFLHGQCPPEVHANAAETLCTVTRNAPSALANKLSSQRSVNIYMP